MTFVFASFLSITVMERISVPYILMQFYPMLGTPLMMALFSPRYTKAAYLFLVIGLYGCAKLLEVCDAQIYDCLGFVSGHALKHFAAALACVPVIVMLRRRQPAGPR